MAVFRVYRLKDHLRQAFRYARHAGGTAAIKPRDYEAGGEIEAATPYAAFFALRSTAAPLMVGDVLEAGGVLYICKFVGFEPAEWVALAPAGAPSGQEEANAASAAPGGPPA